MCDLGKGKEVTPHGQIDCGASRLKGVGATYKVSYAYACGCTSFEESTACAQV
jgi:hypothetical protein